MASSRRSASTTPGPILPGLRHANQGPQRPLVGRLRFQDGVPGGSRRGRIADALLLELGDANEQANPLRHILGAIGPAMQQLGQVGPGLRLGEDLFEGGVGLLVEADLGENLLRSAAGVLRPEQPARGNAQRAS